MWPDGRIEQLGRTVHHHEFQQGIRLLARSTIEFPDAGFAIRCTPILANFLGVGTGYGLDTDWRHGMYQGPDTVVQGRVYDVADIAPIGAMAVIDQSARFEYDGNVGYGLYEHAFSGPWPQYGLS